MRPLRVGMDAKGGDISYRSQILTDFSEIWTEGQKHQNKVIKSDF